ncbi:TrbI/VirB10 family protein [Ferrovibrio xuzhouensis]|uniref:TrbI/VirB10 family protein n=1 Tax=Ferrovibrio xuzhouensis TaxID=1576914 RepID=A0ABV7VBX4_9PROT
MSAICDVLLALNLTFGGLCTDRGPAVTPVLPADDRDVWAFKAQRPEPPPAMPPIIIEKSVAPTPPPPPPPVPPPPPEPPKPNPYRLALQVALAQRGQARGLWTAPEWTTGQVPDDQGGGKQVASLVPPGSVPLGLPSLSIQERYLAEGRTSGLPVDDSRIFNADRYISGIVEVGVNSQISSQQGGSVIIQVSRDAFGYHNRNVLVPKGSRLICDYSSPRKQGETRLAFNCTRILMAGYRAEILQLTTPVADAQGRGGITGDVDNRFWERYGTAFVLAGISAAVRLGSAAGTQTSTTTTSTTTTGSTTAAIADKGAQELSQKFGEISANDLERTINLVPIITLRQGMRVQIRPTQDWYIRRIEDGPATAVADSSKPDKPKGGK